MRNQTEPASPDASTKIPWAVLRALLAVGLAAFVYGCGAQTENFAPPAAPIGQAHPHVVLASWYGPGFEGRTTSSGETFHQDGYTAASRTLPLGSHARVTNVATGRSVVVRINDRGPFVKGRGLDLSHAAARKIGLDRRGVGAVRVTRIDGPSREVGESLSGDVRMTRTERSRRRRDIAPVRYVRSSPLTPVEATTESSSTVSNPFGAWLTELVSPSR